MLTADENAYIREKGLKLDEAHDFANDPEFKSWLKNLTNNILDGIFPREVNDENNEALQFIQKHPTKKLNCGSHALLLFEPLNKEKFEACLNGISYAKDTVVEKEDENKMYCNYYLNNITKLEGIFELLDRIETKERKPFKIAFDCGFIVEDSVEETYYHTAPNTANLGKTIPMIIRSPADMKLYKHLVFATLGNYTSDVHTRGGSRHHFVAMHTIMFQVTRLGPSGARFLVPGYDFLVKNKYIRDYGDNNNLCMFYVVANSKK